MTPISDILSSDGHCGLLRRGKIADYVLSHDVPTFLVDCILDAYESIPNDECAEVPLQIIEQRFRKGLKLLEDLARLEGSEAFLVDVVHKHDHIEMLVDPSGYRRRNRTQGQ